MRTRRLIAIDASSVPALPAGAGRYTLSLVRALARIDHDHDYVIYARSHSLHELGGLGSTFEIVDLGSMSRVKRYLWEQTALPFDLRRRRAALLHSPHHTTPLLCPCPRTVTVHDVTFFLIPERYPRSRRLYFQIATTISVKRARAILVPSASAADDLRAVLNPPAGRVHVTHEGVEALFRPATAEECLAVRKRFSLPEGYLLSLGTLEPGKNRSTLLRALHSLVTEGRDLHLAIAGQTGWSGGSEAAEARELGLEGRVHFLGYVPHVELPALYSAASVFVFPSLHEGFGLPVLEAMASGTPVVTSNRSSLPEVAGDAALLVDPLNEAALAGAIGRILDEPPLVALLRQAGRERAAGFSWDACAEVTLAVYRKLLGETADAGPDQHNAD
jgi:glycosyltransferase involved in cell wall biosynthesis